MKICFSVMFFLFFKAYSLAQEYKPGIQESINLYFEALESKKWNTLLDLTNPRIFEFMHRNSMEQVYRDMEISNGMSIRYENPKILRYNPEFILADTIYVPVDYSITLKINLDPDFYNTYRLKQLQQEFQLNSQFQGIEFDEKNFRFIQNLSNTLIASCPVGKVSWKFWDYKSNDPMTKSIFPSKVLDRLIKGWNEWIKKNWPKKDKSKLVFFLSFPTWSKEKFRLRIMLGILILYWV